MKPQTVARAERLLGGRAVSWAGVESLLWARNEHWTLVLDDGTRAFAKSAWLEPSVTWMRQEWEVYNRLTGPFMPRVVRLGRRRPAAARARGSHRRHLLPASLA